MENDQDKLKRNIAIGVVLVVFLPGIFFGYLFPRMKIFDMTKVGQVGGGSGGQQPPILGGELGDGLDNLSEPVTIFDLEIGEGEEAVAPLKVRVGYIGTFIDQETGEEVVFDQNIDPETGFSFTLGSGQVIPGFDVGVTGMRVGGKRLVVIQPEAAYGNQQVGAIPPNTTLRFAIELYEVTQ